MRNPLAPVTRLVRTWAGTLWGWWLALIRPIQRVWLAGYRPVRRVVAAIVRPIRRMISTLWRWWLVVWGYVRRGLVRTGKIIRVPMEWLWRGLLVFAATTMVAGGVLQTLGQGTTSEITGNGIGLFGQISTSDTVVTIGFFIGIMAVPTWVLLQVIDNLTARLDRPKPPASNPAPPDNAAPPGNSPPDAPPSDTTTVRPEEFTDEDQRNRPDEELPADHGRLSGEPASATGR